MLEQKESLLKRLRPGIEAFAAHVQGKRKLTLRSKRLSLPPPIKPVRPKDITAFGLPSGFGFQPSDFPPLWPAIVIASGT